MDLPFHLKTLPPEALDVLRYFGGIDSPIAHADEIISDVGLSERTFGKVIRRLVTKGYLQMDGDQAYRLSDQGQSAVEELIEYEASAPAPKAKREVVTETIPRHLVVVTPSTLVAGQTAQVYVGFSPASDALLSEPADVVVRLSVLNGEPTRPQEAAFQLDNGSDHRPFSVTPGSFQCLRIRVNVFQLGPNPDDITIAGGLYIDLNVVPSANASTTQFAAYGADITLTQTLE